MHQMSLVSNADFDDSTDMDGEKHSQSNHHQGFHRGNWWSKSCQTIQLLSLADENVVSVFGSYEPFAQCCASFLQSGNHGGANTSLGRDVGLSVKWRTAQCGSRFAISYFRLTFWLCARLDRNGTTRSCMGPLQLCGSSSWRKMKMKKGNLSPFPNGPVHAVIFVNDSAIMNQTDGHWTMAGSVKSTILKPLHSLDTVDVPTSDLDTSCAAMMICVSS